MTKLEEINPDALRNLAKALRANPLLSALIVERERELTQAWATTGDEEADRREALFGELRALHNLRDFFDAAICNYVGDDDKH